jgi:D-lactate dehydrogenase (cytochrome)
MATAAAIRAPLDTSLQAELTQRFGAAFTTSREVCLKHGTDEFRHLPVPPDGVVFATSTADVVDAIKLCRAHDTPLIPYGTGTSVEGHICAVKGGITLDLRGAGGWWRSTPATWTRRRDRRHAQELNRPSARHRPVLSDRSGADACRGMAATRASGTNAVRYGTMR